MTGDESDARTGRLPPVQIAELFSFLKQKFDIDHKKISKSYSNAQKMAWEQVLLLLLYSRQYCYAEGGMSTLARMKLITITLKCCDQIAGEDGSEDAAFSLLDRVLNWLDSGEGCFALVKVLMTESEKAPESPWAKACTLLLNRIEQQAITFPPYGHTLRPCYSHYALHRALTDPVTALQKLLVTGEVSHEHLASAVFSAIPKYLQNRYHSGYYPHFERTEESDIYHAGKEISTPAALAAFCQRYPDAIDKKGLLGIIKAALFEPFSWQVLQAFTLFAPPHNEKKTLSFTHSVFRDVCKINAPNQQLQLDFKPGLLRSLAQLGLIDEVMKEVKEKLLNFASDNHHQMYQPDTPPQDYAQAFDQLDSWYNHNRTTLFSGLDQLPKLIGSLIATDIKKRQGMFDDSLRTLPMIYLHARLTAQDIATLTTWMIHSCLYNNINAAAFTDRAFTDRFLRTRFEEEREQQLEKRLQQTVDEIDQRADKSKFANEMMAEWADCTNIKSALERIKKAHLYLLPLTGESSKGIDARRLIFIQRAQGISHSAPYPINTPFPLPLWSSLYPYQPEDKPVADGS